MKVTRILGTRPQFMQAPSVYRALKAAGIEQELVHTGQHYDDSMSDVFFRELGIPMPDANLKIGGYSQGEGTGRMMAAIEIFLIASRPDVVLVDGDTNSTMAAALAAVKLHIPVAHIEAGLRDFDRNRPEEINRIVTDHVADLNLAPIPRAMVNLKIEGLASKSVLVGDVLCDCFVENRERADFSVFEELGLKEGKFNAMTLHRPENTDMENYERFCDILDAINEIGVQTIFAVHPRTRPILDRYTQERGGLGVIVPIAPISYLEMLGLIRNCDCVYTDSGGLPREAVWAGKRCVMLFRVDTWHDLLEAGWAKIGKTDKQSIITAYSESTPAPKAALELYGAGQASLKIANLLKSKF